MSQPVTILTNNTTGDGMTLMRIVQGELRNWGYDVSEVELTYEPNWGDSQLKIEVKQNEGG